MAESYVTKSYLTTQFQNYSEVIKDKFALNESFDITEETFSRIFNPGDLEKLYQILNEEV